MQIELKSKDFLRLLGTETPESLHKTPGLNFRIFCESLSIYQHDRPVAKFEALRLQVDLFSTKLIIFRVKNDHRQILMEISGSETDILNISQLVIQHNQLAGYKSPLQLEFDREVRDSVLASDKESNLRGLINLFIVFSVVNYSRLIAKTLLEHTSMFEDTVG